MTVFNFQIAGRLDELRLAGKEALKYLPNHASVYYNIGKFKFLTAEQ